MSDDFDMPARGTWEQRGGWLVRRLASEFDLTLVQAAGIVGNLGFESAGFTKLREVGQPDGLGGYGWAQWTGPRHRAFLAFCHKHAFDWRSDQGNFEYLCFELDEPYFYCLEAIDDAATIEAATFTFGVKFEAPGGTTGSHLPGFADRLAYAKRALAGATAIKGTK